MRDTTLMRCSIRNWREMRSRRGLIGSAARIRIFLNLAPSRIKTVSHLSPDTEIPTEVHERSNEQMELIQTLTGGYESIKYMPRKMLLKLKRLAQEIARVIGD